MGFPKIPDSEEIASHVKAAMEPMMTELTAIRGLLAELVTLEKDRDQRTAAVLAATFGPNVPDETPEPATRGRAMKVVK